MEMATISSSILWVHYRVSTVKKFSIHSAGERSVMQKKMNALLIAMMVFSLGTASGQVNTERLRRGDIALGWHNSVSFNLGYVAGNSNFLKLNGGVRTDFKAGKYYTFGVVNYQRGREAGQLFLNKGFAHIRGIRSFTPVISGEIFLQKEFNEFILLNDRNLVGGGIRTRLLSGERPEAKGIPLQLFLGIGFMWENEVLNTSPITETNTPRSTNYISATWIGNEIMTFGLVGYYQVAVTRSNDFRVLLESHLGFQVTRTLTFQLALNYRYDNEPPPGIKNYDLEVTNGLQFDF